MNNTKLYSIHAITNMHAGSGDNNYGVVDKLIQKDPVDKLPTIHSSSLKGAIREFFKNKPNNEDKIIDIFGSDSNSKKRKQGKYIFFEADFLSMPVRSDKIAFLNATSPERIQKIIDKANLLGIEINKNNALSELADIKVSKDSPLVFKQEYQNATIEDRELKATYKKIEFDLDSNLIKTLLGENIVLLNDCNFREISEDMPVLARNQLENGESKNLWYEEVVPHQSRFAFFVKQNNDKELKTHFNKITENRVQIGANATIGYGQTDIKEIKF